MGSTWYVWVLQDGNTALHLAASGGHIAVMRELLRGGASPTSVNQVRSPDACQYLAAMHVTSKEFAGPSSCLLWWHLTHRSQIKRASHP
jgi:hypothetical protein